MEILPERNFKSQMIASFIIITHNRAKFLTTCLNSILKIKNINFEIIVVDNASSDNTEATLKKFNNLIIIRNKENRGVAKARNQGVKIAKGKYIVFLDDDAYFKNKINMNNIFLYLDKNKDVVLLGPRILYPNGNLQESVRAFPTVLSLLWRGTFLSRLYPNLTPYRKYIQPVYNSNKITQVDWLIGACQIIRSNVFKKIGYLDENFFWGYEDVDFCRRIKSQDMKVIYYPDVTVFHHYHRESSKGILNLQKIKHVKSILYYFSKDLKGLYESKF